MRIGICDDEREIREWLGKQIQSFYPQAEIRFFEEGEEVLTQAQPPDILLLDIQLSGQSGMETARRLRRMGAKTVLIFVTALEEYVFEAFDVGAFHYLVKPCKEEKLRKVLSRAVKQYEESLRAKGGAQEKPEEGCIMVKTGGEHRKVWIRDIVYAEVFNRKVTLHTVEGEYTYYGRLSELEKRLGEAFFRPHRAYLVHFRYVVKYDSSLIYLEGGSALMAKQKYSEFVRRYLQYNRRKGME